MVSVQCGTRVTLLCCPFLNWCSDQSADVLTIICSKYSEHIFHYRILQIPTQLQHSERSVSAGMQLHLLSYVETERGLKFQTVST